MVVAFTLELLLGGALVALPLLSSGVIPVSAHTPTSLVLDRPPIVHPNRGNGPANGPSSRFSEPEVVPLASGERTLCFLHCPQASDDNDKEVGPADFKSTSHELPTALACCSASSRPYRRGPIPLSDLSPGSLIHRVEPVYPRIAELSHTYGVVRLHAIIATDGTIQSVSVIDGHPVLVQAARDAVKQWRYRPYILNGHPVEVETIITVNFKATLNN